MSDVEPPKGDTAVVASAAAPCETPIRPISDPLRFCLYPYEKAGISSLIIPRNPYEMRSKSTQTFLFSCYSFLFSPNKAKMRRRGDTQGYTGRGVSLPFPLILSFCVNKARRSCRHFISLARRSRTLSLFLKVPLHRNGAQGDASTEVETLSRRWYRRQSSSPSPLIPTPIQSPSPGTES